MAFAQHFAKRINSLTYAELPPDAVYWAKVGILDTLGVALAGAREDAANIVRKMTLRGTPPGASIVWGTDNKAAPLDASLINGVAAHVLDFDDDSNTLGGHTSACILPALFALAGSESASGRELIAAYVAGIETDCKIALADDFYQYKKGWHTTTSIGIFGVTAACAKLLRLSEEQTATALAMATSFAFGTKSNFGTMTKPLHVGHCSRTALFVAMLAREGLTANSAAFEHEHGYFNIFNEQGRFAPEKVLSAWANPLDVARPGLVNKLYPCCGATHPAIEAAITLATEHNLCADDVKSIDVLLHSRRLPHVDRPHPASPLDAKFSLQYVVARAITDRRSTLEQFEGEAHNDPRVRALMARIHVAAYTAEQFPEDHHFGAVVSVETSEGSLLTRKVHLQLGRTVDVPAPAELLRDKFRNCALRTLPASQVNHIYSAVQSFEDLTDVGEFARLLAVKETTQR